jgi:ABC-type uncharacterized transport system ATPase subunit
MLHQDPLDFPPLTVVENFMAGSPFTPPILNPRAAEREFRQWCARFNFDIDPHAQVGDLTVGERQQLEIVRLLANGVGTLILDEPTTGISASQKTLLFQTLRRLADEGKSIIFVSHKLEDVEALCDRVTVMRRGQVAGELDLRPLHAGAQQASSHQPEIAGRIVELMFGRALAMPTKPPTRRDEVILSIEGLVLRSDRLEIRVDQLSLHRGEVVGIAGLEGSGQQLFLTACAGLEPPAAGSIHIAGRNLTHRPYADFLRAGVCYVPADRLREGLIAGLTIQEHVALRASGRGFFIDRAEVRAEAERADRRVQHPWPARYIRRAPLRRQSAAHPARAAPCAAQRVGDGTSHPRAGHRIHAVGLAAVDRPLPTGHGYPLRLIRSRRDCAIQRPRHCVQWRSRVARHPRGRA